MAVSCNACTCGVFCSNASINDLKMGNTSSDVFFCKTSFSSA